LLPNCEEVIILIEKTFTSIKLSEKALDAAWLRNKTISQNIANADTPEYKRKTVKFEELLNSASNRRFTGSNANDMHIQIGNLDNIDIKVLTDNKHLSSRLDGNNIDIDNEMTSMAKNTIKYNVLIQNINAGFRRLKSVINEGRR
jgi:flagellar basal-body rod protein FlgB